MKKTLLFFALFAASFTVTYAQCTGCTNTISSNVSSGLIVPSGQVYCISSGVIVRGGILVASGGTLCNSGTIRAGIAVAQGGTFNNYGTIDSTDADGIGNNGTFHNYGTITWPDTSGIGNNGLFTNAGKILMDSGGIVIRDTFFNDGIVVAGDVDIFWGGFLSNAPWGSFDIKGSMNVGDPLDSAIVDNYGCMRVGVDFENFYGSVFSTATMIEVGGDWSNSGGTVNGLGSSCGGFKVMGSTANFGKYGLTGNVDMCDAGSPVTGFDLQMGTVGSGVTYCQCQNYCTVMAINDITPENSATVYPNPFLAGLTIELSSRLHLDGARLKIYNVYGAEVKNISADSHSLYIERNDLQSGIYFYSITNNGEVIAAGKLIAQ